LERIKKNTHTRKTKKKTRKTYCENKFMTSVKPMRPVARALALARLAAGDILFWLGMIPTGLRIAAVLLWLRWFAPHSEATLTVPFGAAGQALSVFRPPAAPKRVILFVYGGAWGSGRRWQYVLLARELACAASAEVWVPDYRVFPTGQVGDMVEDVLAAIGHAAAFCNRRGIPLTVVGHSAGAHLALLAAMQRAEAECAGDLAAGPANGAGSAARARVPVPVPSSPSPQLWRLDAIDSIVGISGPYDIEDHYVHETMRGVELISPMARAMGGAAHFAQHSPTRVAARLGGRPRDAGLSRAPPMNAASLLPPVTLIHGDADIVVPLTSSGKAHAALIAAGHERAHMVTLAGIGHSECVLALMSPSHPRHAAVMDAIVTATLGKHWH
jgi:prenylcysteine alpha-carboxyl methylesterase